MKKTQKPGKKKKTGAVIVILLGLLCAVSTVKSCGTNRAAKQEKVEDIVYVGQGSYDPANDGKIVIVCGRFWNRLMMTNWDSRSMPRVPCEAQKN